MIHQIKGTDDLPYYILEFYENLKEGIRFDIISQEVNGGLHYLSDLGTTSKFSQVASPKSIEDYSIIKATTHSNQLVKNIINHIAENDRRKIILIICNKDFNKRHKLFDSSSTSLSTVESTIKKLEYIIRPEFWLKDIIVIEIDSVTRPGELIETGYDKRTFINQ